MKKARKIFLILAGIFICWTILAYVTGFSLVIPLPSEKYLHKQAEHKPGDIFRPFPKMNFKKSRYVAYVLIDPSDWRERAPSLPRCNCLYTTDTSLLGRLSKMKFEYTGGDIATASSCILIYENGKLIFDSAIIIDKNNEAMQGGGFGYIYPVKSGTLSGIIKHFKREKWPIVIL